MTTYKVFKALDSTTGNAAIGAQAAWSEVGEQEASSADAAIRAHVGGKLIDPSKEGVYVAVPVASFKPRTVKLEVSKAFRLRDYEVQAEAEPVASKKADAMERGNALA